MSVNVLIIGLSVVFHSIAAILAFRLIRITGHKIAWILITVSIIIQLIRRLMSFWFVVPGRMTVSPFPDEFIALLISIFMLLGIAWIAPLFLSIRRSEAMMEKERNKAEEEHAKSEAIIAAIGDGLSIQDRNLIVTYQNAKHISFFGDHRGETCYQAYMCTESPCDPCPVLTSFKDGQIHSAEMEKKVNGSTSYFEITTSPLRNAKGDIIAGIEVVRNVDERKRMEQERERLIKDLQEALANIKTLSGLIPICASCKKVRDDEGYWNQIESYIKDRSNAKFSHGICPDCAKKLYPELGMYFGPMLEKEGDQE